MKVRKEEVKNTSLVIVVTSLGVFGRESVEGLLKSLTIYDYKRIDHCKLSCKILNLGGIVAFEH